MNTTLRCTSHAARRQAQRNLSNLDVQFVLEYGRRVRCAGALHIFLGRRDIPTDKATHKHFAHLEGTVLVINDRQEVAILLTAYRNRRALKEIRNKPKYDHATPSDR